MRKGRTQTMQYLKDGVGDVAFLRADVFADGVVSVNESDYKRLLPEVKTFFLEILCRLCSSSQARHLPFF